MWDGLTQTANVGDQCHENWVNKKMGWKGFQGGFETRAGSNGEITQEGKAG